MSLAEDLAFPQNQWLTENVLHPGWHRDANDGRRYCLLLDYTWCTFSVGGSPVYTLLDGRGNRLPKGGKVVFIRWYPDEGLMAANSRGEIYDPQPTVPNESV